MKRRGMAILTALILVLSITGGSVSVRADGFEPYITGPHRVVPGETVQFRLCYGEDGEGEGFYIPGTEVSWTIKLGTRTYNDTTKLQDDGASILEFRFPDSAERGTHAEIKARLRAVFGTDECTHWAEVVVPEFDYETGIMPRSASIAPGGSLDLTANLRNIPEGGGTVFWEVGFVEGDTVNTVIEAQFEPASEHVEAGESVQAHTVLHLQNPHGHSSFSVLAHLETADGNFSAYAYPPAVYQVSGVSAEPTSMPTQKPDDLTETVRPSNLQRGITVEELRDYLELNDTDAWVEKGGQPLPSSSVVGTGCLLHVGAAAPSVLAIYGDVIGSGKLNIAQLVRLSRDINGSEPLTGAFRIAGDLNENGDINVSDLVQMARLLTQAPAAPPAQPTPSPEPPSVTPAPGPAPDPAQVQAACLEAAQQLCQIRLDDNYPTIEPEDTAMRLAAAYVSITMQDFSNYEDRNEAYETAKAEILPAGQTAAMMGGNLPEAATLQEAAELLVEESADWVKHDFGVPALCLGTALARDASGQWWFQVTIIIPDLSSNGLLPRLA